MLSQSPLKPNADEVNAVFDMPLAAFLVSPQNSMPKLTICIQCLIRSLFVLGSLVHA